MPRLTSLLSELRSQHADDWYLLRHREDLSQTPQLRSLVATYDRALDTLDARSWEVLKAKALKSFLADSVDRGKNNFFNHLNESFAYRYLLQRGARSIAFVPETTKRKTPDLSFLENSKEFFCEVKTIGVSDEEIQRTKLEESLDASVYDQLTDQFLTGKLVNTVEHASTQIDSVGEGLVYLILGFDDFTLRNYRRYKSQLRELLTSRFPNREIYIKIGLQSRKRIHHVARPTGA